MDEGKAGESLPYLEHAARLAPCDYSNGYELARAYADSGDYERSTANLRTLLTRGERAGPLGPRGLEKGEIARRFQAGWEVVAEQAGAPMLGNAAAWYRLRRKG